MKKHYKTILIWIGGITLGGVLSYFMGLIVKGILARQTIKYELDISNNWWIVSAIFVLMAALIPAGYLLGRKIENT
jgi:membrane protein YqaA with SNARE-associated domain